MVGYGIGGGQGDCLSPLGTYDSLSRPDWLHASPPALHCIHGVEKSWCYQKHTVSQSEDGRGGRMRALEQ